GGAPPLLADPQTPEAPRTPTRRPPACKPRGKAAPPHPAGNPLAHPPPRPRSATGPFARARAIPTASVGDDSPRTRRPPGPWAPARTAAEGTAPAPAPRGAATHPPRCAAPPARAAALAPSSRAQDRPPGPPPCPMRLPAPTPGP